MNETMTIALLPPGEFANPDVMKRICEAVRFPSEITQALVEETERLAGNLGRADTAVRLHRELFMDGGRPSGEANQELLDAGAEGAMLAAVVYVGGIPQLWERYLARGIAAEILIDTVQDIVIWMETHRKRHGSWGLSELGWLHSHLTGELFRIGRLQFQPMGNTFADHIFRHRSSGEIMALAEGGRRYSADGQLADESETSAHADGSWMSSYAFDGRRYEGNPITSLGLAEITAVQLSADEWEPALKLGDDVLNVHIPEGGRMSHGACRDSYAQAARFFADCFPEKAFGAFVCQSWLLSPQFRDLLPEHSNILQFQRDYRLLPNVSDETQILERVFGFGMKLADLPDAKTTTSLQRIVYDRLAAGGRLQNGSGFILLDEAAK